MTAEQYEALETERDQLTQERDNLQSDLDAISDVLTTEQQRASGLEAQLTAAQEALTAETSRADDAEDEVADLGGDLAATRNQLDDAEAALAEALAEVEALMLAYDPQIQAARAEAAPAAIALACAIGRADARAGRPPSRAAAVIRDMAEDYPGIDLTALLDSEAIEAEVARCHADEKALMAEEQKQARLTASKRDGFWTVGDEIAPGRWRSTGTADDCYWERLDANQEILDNHYGDAGGTVTIRRTDYEVHFDGCGVWEYLGP